MPPAEEPTATPADARAALVRAAEELFAEHGIEGVSLRHITRAAGQRNSTALQYHFGDRDGLLRALVAKHTPGVSMRREALLDRLESGSEGDLRDAAAALVQPLVSKLNDPDGGRQFLQVAAHLVNGAERVIDPAQPVGLLVFDRGGSLERWARMVEPLMPPGSIGAPLHRRFAAIRFAYTELGRRAHDAPESSHSLFASQLTDLVTALLGAPISAETERLLTRRDQG
jgi:AcrR family transcriptional regulator